MIQYLKNGALTIGWLGAICFLAYYPSQDQFQFILPGYCIAFLSYFLILKDKSKINFGLLLATAVVARIIIIPAFPNFSDDIYRFIWDGQLWHNGIHPYASLPSQLIESRQFNNPELYKLLNSPDYYSIYPPVAQLIFWISTFFPNSDYHLEAMIMKTIHVLFDIGTLRIIYLLLKKYNLNSRNIFLYALNPLVIIEVINNVHHEGIMLFFVLLSIYLLKKNQIYRSAIALGSSIATKILPILFVPFLLFRLKNRDRWRFLIALCASILLLFTPLVLNSGILQNLSSSADLYVRSFEFNASVYYLLRCWGQLIYGFNTIHILGPVLKIATILGILIYSFKNRRPEAKYKLPHHFIWIFGLFLFFSSTIHPWYVVMLLGLTPFTDYKWIIIWSAMITLTYINYSYQPYMENLWVVGLEYLVVLLALIWNKIEIPKKITI